MFQYYLKNGEKTGYNQNEKTYSSINMRLNSEKCRCWPVFGFWIGEGHYFQFLKNPLQFPLGKIFNTEPYELTSAKIYNPNVSASKCFIRMTCPYKKFS